MSAEESGGNPVRLDELIAVRCAVIMSSGTGEKQQRDKKKNVSLMSSFVAGNVHSTHFYWSILQTFNRI